ncbi:MAG: DUF1559 domain-containing protein [Planctomycetales bacterium]|nr:DUF1559 domain-containing protein [Planctomycetales bacterium]
MKSYIARALPVRARKAFTLVELLIVIAVIGLLVALLLPAVNAAREASRNTQCKSRVRQLALAMIGYESLHGAFPVSQTASGPSRSGSGCQGGFYSWQARVLPFIEESSLFERIDFEIDLATECNDGTNGLIDEGHPHAGVAMSVVESLLCPSDGFRGHHADVMGIESAPDNYVANAGWPSLSTGIAGDRVTPAKQNGIITVVNSRSKESWLRSAAVRAKQVKDGLSKTACISERLIQRGTTAASILSGPTQTLSFHLTERPRTLGQMVENCNSQQTHADLANSAYIGRFWLSGWAPTAPTYLHVMPPNTNHCHFGHSLRTGDFIVTPSSNHPGGINIAYADGHVAFLPDDIEPTVWWAIGSRNGHETLDERLLQQ